MSTPLVPTPTAPSPSLPALSPAAVTSAARVLRDCWCESRPGVQVVFALRFIAGAVDGTTDWSSAPWSSVILGGLAWVTAVFATYLFNGISDVVEDRASGKGRPIAKGRLAASTAQPIAIAAAGVSAGLALACGPLLSALLAASLLLGYAYSSPRVALKRQWSASCVTAASGGILTVLAGYVQAGSHQERLAPVVAVALAIGAWMGFVGSVAKDFTDVSGDRAAGRRSLAVLFGTRATGRGVGAAALLVAGLFAAATWAAWPWLHIAACLLLAGACAVTICGWRAASGLGAGHTYRAFMWTQYVVTGAVVIEWLVR